MRGWNRIDVLIFLVWYGADVDAFPIGDWAVGGVVGLIFVVVLIAIANLTRRR